jgi:hypothetical protein
MFIVAAVQRLTKARSFRITSGPSHSQEAALALFGVGQKQCGYCIEGENMASFMLKYIYNYIFAVCFTCSGFKVPSMDYL